MKIRKAVLEGVQVAISALAVFGIVCSLTSHNLDLATLSLISLFMVNNLDIGESNDDLRPRV